MTGSRGLERSLAWVGTGVTLLLPVTFLFSRAGAEVLIGLLDGIFLAWCVARGDWAWVRAPWVAAAGAWWAWTVLCTLAAGIAAGPARASVVQALLMGRFFVLAAGLYAWTLRDEATRRALAWVMVACAAWIAIECWQQELFGVNLIGAPRWGDGALTGPFVHPRAGPALVLILFPAMLIPMAALLARPGRAAHVGAWAVALFGTVTMILIGQRMPALLTGLGLLLCGVMLPQLRRVVLLASIAAVALLCALPVVSPPAFAKLVVRFGQQMNGFWASSYGQLYARAIVMTLAHPLLGLGFDGFRHACNDPAYAHGIGWLGIADRVAAGPDACSIHPHNHYLEAATAGGVLGLLLFCGVVASWLWALGVAAWRGGTFAAVGFFIAVVIGLWPFASTSAFFTLPNAGWLFLMLAMGFAELVGITPIPANASSRAAHEGPMTTSSATR